MKISMKEYNLTHFKDKDLYTIDEIICTIQDMEDEIEILNAKLNDEIQDREDNYRRISASEMYDIDDRYFE